MSVLLPVPNGMNGDAILERGVDARAVEVVTVREANVCVTVSVFNNSGAKILPFRVESLHRSSIRC